MMRTLGVWVFFAICMAGCSGAVSEAQVEASIQKCIANGQASFSDKVNISDPDPARRAVLEQQAKQAIAQVAEHHKRQLEQMCRQSMPKMCEQNPQACATL
jgi:uncharacterized protein YllA (UPF0747 family)